LLHDHSSKMGARMWEGLAGTFSVLAGGFLTIASGWFADRRLTARERGRRCEERNERLATRRDEFQRETLLALQEASQKLLRTTGAMYHQDVMEFRKSGRWQRQAFRDGRSEEYLHQNTDTMLLGSRVADNETRALANELRRLASLVTLSEDEREAQVRLTSAAETQEALIYRIGELVRALDVTEHPPRRL
jgi:hypothetical protein